MFLATDNEGWTVVYEVAWSYKIEIFQEILYCAKWNPTREEVNKFFVATDNEGRTVVHEAAGSYQIEIFQKILNCAKRNLTRE